MCDKKKGRWNGGRVIVPTEVQKRCHGRERGQSTYEATEEEEEEEFQTKRKKSTSMWVCHRYVRLPLTRGEPSRALRLSSAADDAGCLGGMP